MIVYWKHDIQDNLGELTELTERVIILLDDIMDNVLYPLENGKETKSPLNLAALAVANAHPAIVKAEIADSILEEMKDKLEALHRIVDPRPLEVDEIPLATSAEHRYYKFTDEEARFIADALTTQEGPIADRLKEVFNAFHADKEEPRTPSNKVRCTAPAEDERCTASDLTEEETRANMVTDYMNSVTDFVSIIEAQPDFIKRMLKLKKAAYMLAAGYDIQITAEQPQE